MNLAGRIGAWAKSGYTAKDYVQDGLIAMWDGIENAGWGVHEESPEYWTNLATGEHDIRLNGAKFGSNHLIGGIASDIIPDFGDAYSTIEYAIYLVNQDQKAYFKPATISSMGSLSFRNYGGNKTIVYCNRGGSTAFVEHTRIQPDLVLNMDHVIQIRFTDNHDPSTLNVISNGIQFGVSKFSAYSMVGSNKQINPPAAGKIYCLRLYDRVLKDEDLKGNRMIDVARFNLPDA